MHRRNQGSSPRFQFGQSRTPNCSYSGDVASASQPPRCRCFTKTTRLPITFTHRSASKRGVQNEFSSVASRPTTAFRNKFASCIVISCTELCKQPGYFDQTANEIKPEPVQQVRGAFIQSAITFLLYIINKEPQEEA